MYDDKFHVHVVPWVEQFLPCQRRQNFQLAF